MVSKTEENRKRERSTFGAGVVSLTSATSRAFLAEDAFNDNSRIESTINQQNLSHCRKNLLDVHRFKIIDQGQSSIKIVN